MKESFRKEILEIVDQLTLDEKISMIHGAGLFRTESVERLGLPCVKMSDGPMGVRKEFADNRWIPAGTTDDYTTYLPCNSALASTWSRHLAYKTGQILGAEARGRGKDVILSPGINIKRSPLCGRNFEYMSEDPYLISELVVPEIKGIQENDVAACVKHFIANNQELSRLTVDTIMDDRTLREIYLPGFDAACNRANSYSIMGAYNKFRGVQCCENTYILNQILREEWGYDGTVISDWGGVSTTYGTAMSGMDIEMSVTFQFDDYFFAKPLKEAVEKGEISELVINEKVSHILLMMYRLKMIGPDADSRSAGCYHSAEHTLGALNVARESVILLKNEENRLPIVPSKTKKLAVIGHNAAAVHSNGGGSAEIKALYEISPLLGIKNAFGGNTDVQYAMGYFSPEINPVRDVSWQDAAIQDEDWLEMASMPDFEIMELRKKASDPVLVKQLRDEAVALAANSEQVVLVCGLNHIYDVEGLDRPNMTLPFEQNALIDEVLDVNPNTILVIVAGSPIEMPWLKKAKSILWCYYAGMETGTAIGEVLTGQFNPCGKLAETFPLRYEDTYPAKLGEFAQPKVLHYRDGIYVGYRYYETYQVPVAFCFGHGLSYTSFTYGKGTLHPSDGSDLLITVPVTNTGSIPGKEIVQLYVSHPDSSVHRPAKELKAFDKISLEPGETKEVNFLLSPDAFAYYSEEAGTFLTEEGEYLLHIGTSLQDIRVLMEVSISF